jgi:hypothetical protein
VEHIERKRRNRPAEFFPALGIIPQRGMKKALRIEEIRPLAVARMIGFGLAILEIERRPCFEQPFLRSS